MAERLFSSGYPGQKEKEYFAEITGSRVVWTGKVRMCYEFSSDFVFGDRKGVKVQLDLCEVNGKFGKQQIRAVAAFPPKTYTQLRMSNGKPVRFCGKLLKLEPFSREIYVAEGELL